jgi:hypothetical protein
MSDAVTEAHVRGLLERLTGQPATNPVPLPQRALEVLESGSGWGYGQFNEVLLLLGYDRICPELFQYFATATTEYHPGTSIKSSAKLQEAVGRFRKLALLFYGNVKFAFKTLRSNPEALDSLLASIEERHEDLFRKRNDPIQPIEQIAPDDTYLLGYIIAAQVAEKMQINDKDPEALALEARRRIVVEIGKRNHSAYLVSDHLDVYVATSMRLRHEYLLVSQFCRRLFDNPLISSLKLRYFDPTQAYCHDRIDKGLAEALMLKRAECTIYLVQESDTLGKDSELASTLAQGKPVIAFVPAADEGFVDDLIAKTGSEGTKADRMLGLLRIFAAESAWTDSKVRAWLSDSGLANTQESEVRKYLIEAVKKHYDRRATTIKDTHPLGIQVNLATGVANGVLVVRSEKDCAELVRRIFMSALQFDIEEVTINELSYVLLREKISGCIFRVMTGDQQLSNAFWNFYLA